MAREAERDGETAAPFRFSPLSPCENSRKRAKRARGGAQPLRPAGRRKEARFTRGKERLALQEIATLVEICLTPQSNEGCGEMRGIYYDNAPL